MLHLKFQIQPSSSSVEEDFFKVFVNMFGSDGHVGHVIQTIFIPKDPGGVYEISFQSAQWFQSFERRRRLKLWTNGRRTKPALLQAPQSLRLW